MTKKLLILSSLAIIAAATSACNANRYWDECNGFSEGDLVCMNGAQYECKYNGHINNNRDNGFFWQSTGNNVACASTTPSNPELSDLIMCQNNTAYQWNEAESYWKVTNACASNETCNSTNGKCDPIAECRANESKCEDGELFFCENNQWNVKECEANTFCLADKADATKFTCRAYDNCVDPADSTKTIDHDASVCLNDTSFTGIKTCNDGTLEATETCNANEVCSTLDGVKGCFEKVDSVIGSPCTCTPKTEGGNFPCAWSFTGEDVYQILSNSSNKIAALKEAVNQDGELLIPNFFPPQANIVDAEGNAACSDVSAPAGMVVGCFREANLEMSKLFEAAKLTSAFNSIIDDYKVSLIKKADSNDFANTNNIDLTDAELAYENLTDDQKTEVDAYVDDFFASKLGFKLSSILDIFTKVITYVVTDISFKSEGGYCVAGAVSATATPEGQIGEKIFGSEALQAQFKKLNAGNHETAKTSLDACPDGSVGVSYSFNQDTIAILDTLGQVDISVDACLKKCNSDYDCNGGNNCIDMPKSIVEEGETPDETVKVCFDKDAFKYISDAKKSVSLDELLGSDDDDDSSSDANDSSNDSDDNAPVD